METFGEELMRTNKGEMTAKLLSRGRELCAAIAGPSEVVERMLFTSPDDLTAAEVREALRASAEPYLKLLTFREELMATSLFLPMCFSLLLFLVALLLLLVLLVLLLLLALLQ